VKDVILLAVSIYLLKQDVVRATSSANECEAMPYSIVKIEKEVSR
jgi:hypothetical protein